MHSSCGCLLPERSGSDAVPELVGKAGGGDQAAVARLISLVEDESPLARDVMAALAPHPGHAHVVGLTGAPGVGKSTMTAALVGALRCDGQRVAVLAIDPSSPFSGGALLGDRIRMSEHATDPGVYIRSMAARGHLGGLAATTPQALRILAAAGYDVVLIETVGVGQSEVEVAELADTTVVMQAPGAGDSVQAAKAGILEVGDLYLVNKSDQDGADRVARDLVGRLAGVPRAEQDWRPPVLTTCALTGAGVEQVRTEVARHLAWLQESGGLRVRRTRRARSEIQALALARVRARWVQPAGRAELDQLAEAVGAGRTDPYSAADALVDAPG